MLKVQRAANLFQELKQALLAEQIAISPKELSGLDLGGGMLLMGGHKPDPQIALILGDLIHNLRASLDLAAGDYVRLFHPEKDEASFPFVRNEKHLDDRIKSVFVDCDPQSFEIVKRFRPHPEGDRHLWALHLIDIFDKHRIVLPHIGLPITNDPRNPYLWSGSDECDFAIMLTFQGEPLDNEPMIPTIHRFFDLAQSIIREMATTAGYDGVCIPVDYDRPL